MTTQILQARNRTGWSRRGFFLILVLVVVAMASMAAYSFTDLMLAYDEAAYLTQDSGQAELMVESGAEAVRLVLAQPRDVRDSLGGVFSNPQLFQAVNVVPGVDASGRGNFTIITSALDETGQISGTRFGLQNESARLNLNVLPTLESSGGALIALTSMLAGSEGEGTDTENVARSLLMALPGMSTDTADAILDFIDADSEAREFGAEDEYYLTLPSPYRPKNGPLDSVEELLLVKGVTPQLLFGADANRNGVIDASEQMQSLAMGNSTMVLGWSAYLTVHSLEANKRADGTPRINVNSDDLETLYADLSAAMGNDAWASFIVAYRIAGTPSATSAASLLGAATGQTGGNASGGAGTGTATTLWTPDILEKMDLSGGGGTKLTQLLDLVNAQVTVDNQTFLSPFLEGPIAQAVYMPALMANLSTQDYKTMPGRININECPAELIRGIPLISAEVAEAIIEARGQGSDSENRKYETWPLVEGLVSLDEMKLLMPLVTSGGDVYRAQIVGYYEGRNGSSRAEVVIDATTANPKIIYWRDLSHLGRGFDVSVLGVRAADAMEEMIQSAN